MESLYSEQMKRQFGYNYHYILFSALGFEERETTSDAK